MTAPPAGRLRVNRSLAIPLDEVHVRATTSGGPGGQHANRSRTRVEVDFDVLASRSLGPRQRARLLERLGPIVRAAAATHRSQARNRELALERLAGSLASALHVERPRRATAPSAAARQRRLDEKRRHSERKATRRPPAADL
jgi:ribosome-associated protein